MQWIDPTAEGYTHFRPEKEEIRAVNAFADVLDAPVFLAWLQARPLQDRHALVCVLLAYGCKYNRVLEPVDSFPSIVRPLVEHMKTWLGGDNGSVNLDQQFAFNYVRSAADDAFPAIAEWAFTFYARNENWRKFSELQP